MHDRVADEDAVENVVALDVAFGADLVDQARDRLAHRDRHAFAAVRVHHHVGDAAHQILAEADLRVGRAGRGGDAARQQRHQMHGDRGRADVAGKPVAFVLEARPQADDARGLALLVLVDRRRDGPVALAQDALDERQQVEVDVEGAVAPVLHQHGLQAVHVAERLVHVGLVDLDVAHVDARHRAAMILVSASLRTTCALMTVSCGTSMTRSPRICAEQDSRRRSGKLAHRCVALLLGAASARCDRWRRRSCAWRNCLPAPRSGSARRWRARRTRSRHRRRASARRRAPACPIGNRPRLPDGMNSTSGSVMLGGGFTMARGSCLPPSHPGLATAAPASAAQRRLRPAH